MINIPNDFLLVRVRDYYWQSTYIVGSPFIIATDGKRERENWSLLFGLVNEGGRNTNHLSIRSFIERKSDREREREKIEREGMIKVKA